MQHVSRGFDKAGESTPESLANQDVLREKAKFFEESAGHHKDGLSTATYTVVSQGHIPLKDPPSNLSQIRKFTVDFER
ncbi:MAG: hypothetical protein VCB77_08180 [Alphaproteobacteria bacterium]